MFFLIVATLHFYGPQLTYAQQHLDKIATTTAATTMVQQKGNKEEKRKETSENRMEKKQISLKHTHLLLHKQMAAMIRHPPHSHESLGSSVQHRQGFLQYASWQHKSIIDRPCNMGSGLACGL